MPAALTQLIPILELPPGYISVIRNQVIDGLLKKAVQELHLPQEQLVVRDVRPYGDLQMYCTGTTDSTGERWLYMSTTTTVGFLSITGSKTMADQRYVALYGVRDRRLTMGATGSSTVSAMVAASQGFGGWRPESTVSAIKISVGGSDKVIWDTSGLEAYTEAAVGISPSAVIIPQNTLFQIYYYKSGNVVAGACPTAPVSDQQIFLQLMGITIEPRGKLISP